MNVLGTQDILNGQGRQMPVSRARKEWVIAEEDRKRLREVRPWRFVIKLLMLGLLLGVFAVGVLHNSSVSNVTTNITKLVCQFCIGVMFAHAVELVHQCLHKTAIGVGVVDHWLGRMLGWPAGVSFWHYLYSHLYHHKHNGTENDKESFGYTYELLQSKRRAIRVLGLLWHLSQLGHYGSFTHRAGRAVVGKLAGALKAETPAMPNNIAQSIQQDYQIMAGWLLSMATVSIWFKTNIVVDLWLVPLLIGYGPAHSLIELPEHFGCDHPTGDTFTNTRSIKAGRFGQWLTNFNCHHVGHHEEPHAPLENAPEVERLLQSKHDFKFLEESYPRFYARFLRFVWKGIILETTD